MSLRNFINARFNPNTDIYHLIRTDDMNITCEILDFIIEDDKTPTCCEITFERANGSATVTVNSLDELDDLIQKVLRNDHCLRDLSTDDYGCHIINSTDEVKIYARVDDVSSLFKVDKQTFLGALYKAREEILSEAASLRNTQK